MSSSELEPGVTVAMPTIPLRAGAMFDRALNSALNQTRPPTRMAVFVDKEGLGAAGARNGALDMVTTEWVAFLDDDDELKPDHLERLTATQTGTGADLVYPWYDGINQGLFPFDPLGREFDEQYIREVGNYIPITCLVRTQLLRDVGGFAPFPWSSPDNPCEDWATWVKLLDAGARFVHCPYITWTWHGHPGHTSGRPWNMRRPV